MLLGVKILELYTVKVCVCFQTYDDWNNMIWPEDIEGCVSTFPCGIYLDQVTRVVAWC